MAQKYKKGPRYTYDYPENREIGKLLNVEDRKRIAESLEKDPSYIYHIFVMGDRTNQKAIDLAKIIIEQKQEFERLAKAI
jgi:hypothetical protein